MGPLTGHRSFVYSFVYVAESRLQSDPRSGNIEPMFVPQ